MSTSLSSLDVNYEREVSHCSSNSVSLFKSIICLHVLLPIWPGLFGPLALSTHNPLVTDDLVKSPLILSMYLSTKVDKSDFISTKKNLLNTKWVKEEIKKEMKKYPEMTENRNTTCWNLYNAAKVVLRGHL